MKKVRESSNLLRVEEVDLLNLLKVSKQSVNKKWKYHNLYLNRGKRSFFEELLDPTNNIVSQSW